MVIAQAQDKLTESIATLEFLLKDGQQFARGGHLIKEMQSNAK